MNDGEIINFATANVSNEITMRRESNPVCPTPALIQKVYYAEPSSAPRGSTRLARALPGITSGPSFTQVEVSSGPLAAVAFVHSASSPNSSRCPPCTVDLVRNNLLSSD